MLVHGFCFFKLVFIGPKELRLVSFVQVLQQSQSEAVLSCVSRLKEAVDSGLRLGSIKRYKFTVDFRLNVFKYLFGSKFCG